MILVAGATGSIGRHVVSMAHDIGANVRALARSWEQTKLIKGMGLDLVAGDATDPDSLKGICDGVTCVVSCLGASVSMRDKRKASFSQVDIPAHENLIREALSAGVRRFVYVSVHAEPGYSDTAYVRAHQRVEAMLKETSMEVSLVRPTGLFNAYDELVSMSMRGRVPVIGWGEARTNPVHPKDVADICLKTALRGGADVSVGGPEVFTRAGIARLAFDVRSEEPKLIHVPPGVVRFYGKAAGAFNARLRELTEFAVEVSTHDAIAPPTGYHRLRDHFYLLSRELERQQ